MMPFVSVKDDDPRTKVCAYVRDAAKRNLFEVVDNSRGVLVLENCVTGFRLTISRAAITTYTLVKAAPSFLDASPIHEGKP